MSKYEKNLGKALQVEYKNVEQLDAVINSLEEMRSVLDAAIEHYSNSEKLNDWRQASYQNAKDSYERKRNQIDGIILQLGAKRANFQTPTEPTKV